MLVILNYNFAVSSHCLNFLYGGPNVEQILIHIQSVNTLKQIIIAIQVDFFQVDFFKFPSNLYKGQSTFKVPTY